MLTQYITVALERAHYEWLVDSNVYYGEIPELPGVWATGETLERCQAELQEVLEDWIVIGLARNDHIPVIAGIDVNVESVR